MGMIRERRQQALAALLEHTNPWMTARYFALLSHCIRLEDLKDAYLAPFPKGGDADTQRPSVTLRTVKTSNCMTKTDVPFRAHECTSCRMQIVSSSIPHESKDEPQTHRLLRTWHDLERTDALAALFSALDEQLKY